MKWGNMGIRSLGQMNPDQKQKVATLEQHIKTAGALRRRVGAHCPPELLSCQLCVLSHKALDAYDSDWITGVRAYIKVIASRSSCTECGCRQRQS